MRLNFGHHLLPLLPLPGTAAGFGGKAHLAAAKAACKHAERINEVLKLAGRFELALPSAEPDFFDPAQRSTKVLSQAWETIRTTNRLQWVILTRNPESISKSLPPTWVGKGFQNVCIGLVADGGVGLSEKLQALRNAPVQHRMILVTSATPPVSLDGQLGGIDWVVFTGDPLEATQAAAIGDACRQANVAFLFHQPGGCIEPCPTNDSHNDELPWKVHPFGTKLQLARPTLPDLHPMSAPPLEIPPPPASATALSVPPSANDMKSTDPPNEPAPQVPQTTAEPPIEIQNLEVVPAPTETSSTPLNDADHEDFVRLDGVVRQGLDTFIEVGGALDQIHKRGLWQAAGHHSWAAYCQAVGGLTKIHANRLIKASGIGSHLSQVKPTGFTGPAVTPRSEWQIRPLSRLSDAKTQVAAWYRAVEIAGGQPTESIVAAAVEEIIGDKPATPKSKPNRRTLVIAAFNRLRDAVLAGLPQNELEHLLGDLGKLLDIRAAHPSVAESPVAHAGSEIPPVSVL